jgi:signal transduction histidine kinase/tetratricopeptide (TPR) repeat protein
LFLFTKVQNGGKAKKKELEVAEIKNFWPLWKPANFKNNWMKKAKCIIQYQKFLWLSITCSIVFLRATAQNTQNSFDELVHKIESLENNDKKASAAILIDELIEQSNLAKNAYYQIIGLNKKSHYAIDNNKFKDAFELNETSIRLALENNQDSSLAYLYTYKSKILLKIDNIEGAIYYLLQAEKCLKKSNDQTAWAFYYNSLANFYYNQQEYRKAIDSYWAASKKYLLVNNRYYYRSTLDNIGICYRNLQQYDTAEVYFNRAIAIAKRGGSRNGMINSYINLSKNYFYKNQLDKALDIANYINQEILLHQLSNEFLLENTLNLANIYLKKLDFKKLDSTLGVLNLALPKTSTSMNTRLLYFDLLKTKYKITNQKNEYINALENYILLKDSINNLKKLKLENGVNDKFEIAEKVDTYNELLKDLKIKELENKWIITFSLVFLAVLSILIYLFYKAKLNINQLKKLQTEIEKQNKELSIFNKQKDYILATVAHDLRGPVGNIKTLANVVSQDATLDEENQQLITLISQSADLSLNIINDLADAIDVDRKTELTKQDKIIIADAVKTAVNMQNSALKKKNIEVKTELIPDLEIRGDKSLIIRVLHNLITNATKFSNPDSTITVQTAKYQENQILIKVIDQGIGINPDKLKVIFEPFTSESRKGTAGEKSIGLGLYICKKIILLHNGKIWVESKPNQGSEFIIILPTNYLTSTT